MTNNKVSQLFIYLGDEKFTKISNTQMYIEVYDIYKTENKVEKKEIKKRLK